MHKATGADGLSTKILKMAAPAISSSLAKLINYCIDNGCFPSAWKLAKAIPIYKGKGSKLNMSNYRPISAVLPLLSKIFERHILYNHLKDNSLLYNLQSEFHKTYSTETALVRLIDQINGLVFIDYKKAFDLIDHNILLSKLGSFYIAPKELALFENYLKDRTQFVNLNEYNSAHNKITHGVPQGSILGPLLFLVAINDLLNVVTKSMVDIYADDTTLSASASINSFSSVRDFLQDDINQVTTWSINNKVIINPSKTKALVITGKRLRKKLDTQNLNLMALGNSIDQVNSEKLLGVTMDSNLLFDDHIDELCKKVAQRIGVLKNIRKNLPIKERKLFFNSMIKPVMLYGSTVWESCSRANIEKIYKLQKRAARVIQ